MALINCKKCGKLISHKAESCPFCGNLGIKHCKECGAIIEDESKACPNCGNPSKKTEVLPETKTVYIETEKKSGGGIWAFVGVLIAIILVIIIIGSF